MFNPHENDGDPDEVFVSAKTGDDDQIVGCGDSFGRAMKDLVGIAKIVETDRWHKRNE